MGHDRLGASFCSGFWSSHKRVLGWVSHKPATIHRTCVLNADSRHGPVAVPTLAELQSDPGMLNRLPLDILVELRRQVRRLDADLDAEIAGRMGSPQTASASDPERVVPIEEAAQMLGTSKDTLHTKWNKLPFAF